MEKKQHKSLESHSKTHPINDVQKNDNPNSVSEQLRLLNLSNRSVIEKINDNPFKKNMRQKDVKTQSLRGKQKFDNPNSVSERFGLLNLDVSPIKRNVTRDKYFINDIDKHEKSKNKSSRDGFHSDRFYGAARSNNKIFDFIQGTERIDNRRKHLESQCSSLRSSVSSLISCDDTDHKIQPNIDREKKKSYPNRRNKNINNHFTSNLANKGSEGIGNRRKHLESHSSSLRSSVSSLISCDDTDHEVQINIDREKKKSYPNRKNKKINNHFTSNLANKVSEGIDNRRNHLESQCSSLRSSVSSLISCDDTDHKIQLNIDSEKKKSYPICRNKKINNHFTSHLSNHYIKSWINKNDDSLTHLIIKNKDGFKNLFSTYQRVNDMIVIFELLNRICETNDRLTKEYFLSFSLTQQFIENIDSYISCILLGSSKDTLKNLEYLLRYYSEIIHFIPYESLDDYLELLTSSLEKMEKISHIPELMVNNVKDLITNVSEKLKEINTQFDVSNLSILPSSEDIEEIPELDSNIITGPYQSPSQYLNIHFKLLKEDFVSNLRSGLKEYESNLKEKKSCRIKDLFVYDAVYCGLMKHSRKSSLSISFEIDNKKLKNVDWSTSKRLIHGSLLLISADNFKTYTLTLLDDKRTPKSEDKQFQISALVMDKLVKFKAYTKCTIIEPKVFFNPYFQVLRTIKKIDPNIFPMEKYIIQASTEINSPVYLNNATHYFIAGNEINLNSITTYEYPEIFGLNEFQISALQAALTKEFVIIQGPPGTGKSYLGLKIINILLNNCSAWKKDKSPILVICYRNNAVDQILESLIKDGRKIVRLGNQSSNKHVKDYCLRNAVQDIRTNPVLRDKINFIKDQIQTLKSQISKMMTVIDIISDKKGVLSIDSLSDVLTEKQKQCLSKSNVFEEWLFGGDDLCDSNEELLDGLPLNNWEYNSSFNQHQSSYLLLHINELMNELCDLIRKIDDIYSYNDQQKAKGQDVLLDVIEILQEYGVKELFLKKVINRINLEIDNYIDITLLNPDDLFELSIPERWKLYKHWADLFCKQSLEKIEECLSEINKQQNALDELNDMSDGYKVLQLGPDVVGATTTGAARTRSLLTVIQPKIVIFEEAAEVLESHTITALTQFCEHVIMIGDHQQLRPNPANHISVVKYKLDISLFERMIKNGIEYFTLNEQHRMRPLISSLVIPQFYPHLLNHTSVENYPDVRGLRDNMYFVDHIIPEDELLDCESHRNKYEANFILALAEYILKQGYNKEEITILTFYAAQLFFLKAVRSNYPSLKGVSIEVVDNFQGEENKIILLSLVRSNPHSIGFLSKMNRICVALTRAREGFYLIGNMTTLKANSSVWKGINDTLQSSKVIGNELPLKCTTHGIITNVRTAEDFSPLVFGGCTQICGAKLECSHVCELQCHGTDECHLGTFSCQKPCERKAGCKNHDCKALCGVSCPKCDVIVETVLPCGHTGEKECEGGFFPCKSNCTDVLNCGHPCSKECHFPEPHLSNQWCPMPCGKPNVLCPFGHKCQKPCGEECGECVVKTITTLPCGHTVNKQCNKIKDQICEVLVLKSLDCGHTAKVECFKSTTEVECTESIVERLPCGHDIEVPCVDRNIKEQICMESVEKSLPCGHSKTIACHLSFETNLDCEELVKKELKCGHGFKLEKCSTPPEDILCKKKILKTVEECGHQVKLMCYMKSCKAVCKQPCNLMKPCGHLCSGFCGQPCPDCPEMVEVDQLCGHKGFSPCKDITDSEMSNKNINTTHVGLNCDTPCGSILKCGHQCEGTCGKCMQGRIHEACVASCGTILLCGHVCSNNCSSGIHLCNKKCLNTCKHQTCKNKCSQPCQRCKQQCEWQCEHFRCTKLCWEDCNRPVCEAPCKKLLPCGHICNGFCGEPCPIVCVTCNPENFNSKSKYILLEDCGHFISKNEFLALTSATIGLFLCPSCQKPQTSSYYIRYYTNQWFVSFPNIRKQLLNKYNNVRGLVYDTKSLLGRLRKLLKFKFHDFEELPLLLNGIIESVKSILLKQNENICIENLRSLLFVSYYISEAFKLLQQRNQNNDLDQLSRLNLLASYLKKWENGISRDQMYQFKNELFRLMVICKLNEIKEKRKNVAEPIKKMYLNEAMELTCRLEEFNDDKQKNIVSLINKIDSNFEINFELLSKKFVSIFEKYYTLTLHKESWMKCKRNGHIFYSPDNVSEVNCPTCIDKRKEYLI